MRRAHHVRSNIIICRRFYIRWMTLYWEHFDRTWSRMLRHYLRNCSRRQEGPTATGYNTHNDRCIIPQGKQKIRKTTDSRNERVKNVRLKQARKREEEPKMHPTKSALFFGWKIIQSGPGCKGACKGDSCRLTKDCSLYAVCTYSTRSTILPFPIRAFAFARAFPFFVTKAIPYIRAQWSRLELKWTFENYLKLPKRALTTFFM